MGAKIHTLIEKPFGPYPQYQILADKWLPSSTKIPTLTDVFLYANDRVIGLDDTEVLYPPPASVPHPAKSDIQWYGVLTVDNLKWLSDQGRAWLEADLQKRDIDLHINKASSGLTLDALYGSKKDEGLKIRVYLQGEKHASITYFVDNVHPTKMILTSRLYRPATRPTDAIQRRYIVESLDIDMIPTSRNFLARYQLLASMEHIVSTDPSPPPRALRDIEYWISGYLRCRPAIEQHRRYIFAPPDDADDADDRDDDPNHDPNPGEPTSPRYLRHLHRCTVAGMFAAQAEWMLAQQLGPPPERRIVDLRVWYAFCAEVRHIRSKVPESGGWGRPYGYKEKDADNGKTLKEFIQKKFFVPDSRIKRLEKACKKSSTLPTRTPTPEPEDTRPSPVALQHHYDSDFTDNLPSSSEASDPDSTSITSIPMADLASVPAFCFTRPSLLAGTFFWKCPGHGCDFRLDLMHPDKSSATIDPRHIAWLKNPQSWRNTAEPRLRERFDAIVSAHYLQHIRAVDLDYEIVLEAQRITFSRKRAPTPERTPPPPPPRKKIKVEEVEPTTHYPRLSRSRQSSNRPTPGASRVFIR
ncbi:hypothetical protein PLEOSDRAFT_1113083 [Pleurotus ostreatus PC15]|uniref:Uncharacterized protein n=1 Tax=Pleurotus ostreatus (strain PC15) TaxID=1137138 RepID=A0A067NQU5_PLEO1|nr:hypothetical protein PLEOSDRAFT_1113083 [Pleurotus ostreatus PC15]